MKAVFDLPFVQVALPIIFTFVLASIVQNKRIDDLRADLGKRLDNTDMRLDKIDDRLVKIDGKLDSHNEAVSQA